MESPKFRGEVPRTLSVSDEDKRNEDGKSNCGLFGELEHTNTGQEPIL